MEGSVGASAVRWSEGLRSLDLDALRFRHFAAVTRPLVYHVSVADGALWTRLGGGSGWSSIVAAIEQPPAAIRTGRVINP
ncbi:hypothetical protein E4U48_004488 [Claviceps purpurea]|nr:hypothetical protein E4U48_004488 [Claviceps purpurea]